MEGLNFGIHIGKIPEDMKQESGASIGISTDKLNKAIAEDSSSFFTLIAYDQKTADEFKELSLLCVKKRVTALGHVGTVKIKGETIGGVFGLSLFLHKIK